MSKKSIEDILKEIKANAPDIQDLLQQHYGTKNPDIEQKKLTTSILALNTLYALNAVVEHPDLDDDGKLKYISQEFQQHALDIKIFCIDPEKAPDYVFRLAFVNLAKKFSSDLSPEKLKTYKIILGYIFYEFCVKRSVLLTVHKEELLEFQALKHPNKACLKSLIEQSSPDDDFLQNHMFAISLINFPELVHQMLARASLMEIYFYFAIAGNIEEIKKLINKLDTTNNVRFTNQFYKSHISALVSAAVISGNIELYELMIAHAKKFHVTINSVMSGNFTIPKFFDPDYLYNMQNTNVIVSAFMADQPEFFTYILDKNKTIQDIFYQNQRDILYKYLHYALLHKPKCFSLLMKILMSEKVSKEVRGEIMPKIIYFEILPNTLDRLNDETAPIFISNLSNEQLAIDLPLAIPEVQNPSQTIFLLLKHIKDPHLKREFVEGTIESLKTSVETIQRDNKLINCLLKITDPYPLLQNELTEHFTNSIKVAESLKRSLTYKAHADKKRKNNEGKQEEPSHIKHLKQKREEKANHEKADL